MLLYLIDFLTTLHIKVPTAFTYFSTRMLLAAATTLLLTIFLGPSFIKKLYSLKMGQPIRDLPVLAELHRHKKNTPTMGGVLLLFSMVVSLLLWMDLASPFTWILCFVTLALGFLGGIDDYLKLRYKNSSGLPGRFKLIVQLLVSSLVALSLFYLSPTVKQQTKTITYAQTTEQLYIPFCKDPLPIPAALTFFLALFVITGASNAVNLTDGLDGLAAGCLVMVSCVFALLAFLSNHLELARYLNILYIEGSGEIGIYLMALSGACLGFLWYNGYPSQVFMGDTGSLPLGGILGVSSVLLRHELLLAIAGFIFVAEALSVILQVLSFRYRNKQRLFLCSPLHHHFEYKGWPETKVVLRFWIISLLFAIIAVGSIKLQ
jgi:phospho-N-acetylmuramoyl-pentapeptide-transferase